MIDYIDGKLSPAERAEIERELAINDESFQNYEQLREVIQIMNKATVIEPGKKLRAGFEIALREEQTLIKTPKIISFQSAFYKIAAALALVMAGIAIGYWINRNQKQEVELMALKKEVETTKQIMMTMLVNQQSASQRMLGATVAYKMNEADDEIVNALVKAMNEDPNLNVRLAALEALSKFHEQAHVRKALIMSLTTQTDPVVQISLIRLMVELKEKESLEELQRITNDEEALPAVKDEAHVGIMKLS